MNCCRTVGDTPMMVAQNGGTLRLSGLDAHTRGPMGSLPAKNIVTNC